MAAAGGGSGTAPPMEMDRPAALGEVRSTGADPVDRRAMEAAARAVVRGRSSSSWGPPGVGKTSIAQSGPAPCGRKYCGSPWGVPGTSGHPWAHGATYGEPCRGGSSRGCGRVKSKNPVFLLDEVRQSWGPPSRETLGGPPGRCWIHAQNSTFTDHYLGDPLSTCRRCSHRHGANYMDPDSRPPLLTGWSGWDFAGYTEQEKLEIAKRYLSPGQAEGNGLGRGVRLTGRRRPSPSCSSYTREAGWRQLEREDGEGGPEGGPEDRLLGTTPEMLVAGARRSALLGPPGCTPKRMAIRGHGGLWRHGMFYTPMGGTSCSSKASVMPGKAGPDRAWRDVMRSRDVRPSRYAKSHHGVLGRSPRSR